MNREDLKQGEYYFNDTGMSDVVFIYNDIVSIYSIKAHYYLQIIRPNTSGYFKKDVQIGCQNIRLATPEEKHWLDECIRLNKFITKEVAMETFTKFKVGDWVGDSRWSLTLAVKVTDVMNNKIYYNVLLGKNKKITMYTSSNGITNTMSVIPNEIIQDHLPDGHPDKVVKEPEFVLPKDWVLKITRENLAFCRSLEKRELGFPYNYNYSIGGYYSPSDKLNQKGFISVPKEYTLITFEQFKKYVLKEGELQQPSKDASIEEILEYCKKKYPFGTKFKALKHNCYGGEIRTITRELTDFIGKITYKKAVTDGNNGFIYSDVLGYAEIVEETKPIKATVELRNLPKTYTLEELTKALTKEYDKVDVEDILKVIKTIK